MDSILTSIKKLLGIAESDTNFDVDIIMHINSALGILNQLGVGPSTGFAIEDDSAEWTDFVSDMSKIQFAKTYVYQKVKLIFDPPPNSFAVDALTKSISELEWRLSVQADS